MGWSCRKDAGDTMDAIIATMGQNMGNVWQCEDKKTYIAEISRKEHEDGAITGSVIELIKTDDPNRFHSHNCGGFRINGNGTVARWPKANQEMREIIQQRNTY